MYALILKYTAAHGNRNIKKERLDGRQIRGMDRSPEKMQNLMKAKQAETSQGV